jgi:hypothetical protein
MKNLSKLKLGVYLIALFLAGVVTGAIIMVGIGRHLMPNEEKMASRWSAELRSKLDITAEQAQAIDPIIKETIGAFKITFANDALSALTNGNARIALQLTAEQKKKFEPFVKEQEAFIASKFGMKPEAARSNR